MNSYSERLTELQHYEPACLADSRDSAWPCLICRHVRALRAGVDLYTVSKLLRHASVVMSERYARLSRGDLKAVVNRKPVGESGANEEGRADLG